MGISKISQPMAEQKIDTVIDCPPLERQNSINENWQICCSGSSSHFIKYAAQVLVCFAMLIFSLVNISLGHNDPVYWSLLMLIVGVFVPSPSLKKGGQ